MGISHMLQQITAFFDKRRARTFLDSVPAWYRTCNQVSKIIGDALHDEAITRQDIGAVIDKADRLLMNLGFYIPEAHGLLRKRNPELARRFDDTSQKVFRLRNETTRFLIRSQGPGIIREDESDNGMRQVYYYRALEEAGFKARKIHRDLDKELQSIWREMQVMMIQAERTIANQM
jgi:hypothetical protein